MTVSIWQRDLTTKNKHHFDVCILGAGIAGASVAWWLRRLAPELKVCIVEKNAVGAGASGRNAGMVLAGLASHYDEMVRAYGRDAAIELWQATLDHRRHLDDFLRETNANVGYEPLGSWRLGMEPAEREHLELSATLLEEDGFSAVYRPDDPLGRGFFGALGIEEDCGVQPLMLVRAMIAAAGATLFGHQEVYEIIQEQTVAIRTPELEIRADRIIIALNAYAGLVDPTWQQIVTPHRGQILVTTALNKRMLEKLVYAHHGYIYFRQLPDTRFLIGGWRHEYADAEAGYEDTTTPELQTKLEDFMRRYFPEAATAPIEARWSGTMGFSPDGVPIADTKVGCDRIFYLLGFTGHGFGLALEVGRRLVELIIHGKTTGVFAGSRLNQSNCRVN
jgi:glycine/D-amino acid oxidase-like deaminating enzyme